MLRDVVCQLGIRQNSHSMPMNQDNEQQDGSFSLIVVNVGKLQLVLIQSVSEEDIDGAALRNLWNIAITHMPPVETILYDSR